MFRTIGRYVTVIACLFIGASSARTAVAQHHWGHDWDHDWDYRWRNRSSWPSFQYDPRQPYDTGVYSTYGGNHYYTPAARRVQREVLRPQIRNGAPQPYGSSQAPPPSGPIAPQSVKLEFAGFKQTADLAGRLEFEVNRLCLDMHYNFQQLPGFAKTYGEAYQILQIAKNLQSAQQRGDRTAISKEASGLETRFYQVQQEIKQWPQSGRGLFGDGDINGRTKAIESILRYLLYDVGVKFQQSGAQDVPAPPPAPANTPQAPAPAAPSQ